MQFQCLFVTAFISVQKPDTGLASSLSKPAQAINANGSNGSVAHSLTKTNARLHSSAGEKSVIDLAAAENAQKRARLGKLDMFITVRPV